MHLQTSQMRFLVIIVAALMILGLAAFGLVLAQKRLIPTATTAHIAPATPEASALPARAPVGQTAQATGSEASATRMQAPPAAATATPNVKDLNSSSVSMTMVHETTRLKIDASGWRQKLQDIELDLKKNQQDVEATGKDIDECLVVMRAAAGRLAPDAEIRVAFRKQEAAVRDLAIHVEVHSDPEIRKQAGYFQRKSSELRALNRSVEEIRTRLVTQMDRLKELKIQLEFNRAAVQIDEAVKAGEVSLDNIQSTVDDAQQLAADLDGFGRKSPMSPRSAEGASR
jgi:hypothetical protein